MSRIRYSIVIPAFNEEHRISATLDSLLKFFGERGTRAELVVVDDGSTDRTADVVLWYRRKSARVRLVRLQHQGKGSAVRYGVAHAHGEFVFLCDADLKQSVTEMEKLDTALMRGADVAIGSRWIGEGETANSQPFYRRISGRVFNYLAQSLLGLSFKDTQCGLKAFTREAAQTLFAHQRIDGWGFDPELLFLAQRMGYRVEEVSIELLHDYSTSRFRPVRDGLRAFKELFQIFVRDLTGAYPRPMPAPASAATVPAELTPLAEPPREAA
jgi:dolichyl-phosphate beta-glucosyltransferase